MDRATKLCLLVWMLMVLGTANAQVYHVTDLGPFSPAAINRWGQVVGTLNNHAYMWTRSGGLVDLGLLPGGTVSSAAAINDLGEVAGAGDEPAVECEGYITPQASAFFWTATDGMVALGTVGNGQFPPCAMTSYAAGINIQEQVVGTNGNPSTTYIDGFVWTSDTAMTLLPTIWQSHANAINTPGQIVGDYGYLDTNLMHASLWTQGELTDLGALGISDPENHPFYSFCSGANSINDLNQVVGWSTPTPQVSGCEYGTDGLVVHAFAKTPKGDMQDLGTLPGDTSSIALKINLFGKIIGVSGNSLSLSYGTMTLTGRPFVWTRKKGMQDLNALIKPTSGWILNSAADINIWGQIVGSGLINGEIHGFLLTPKVLLQQ